MGKRVLVIKTSSMGDVIHALPALTDAQKLIPNLSFDWIVEKGFAQIPSWHSAVNRIIEIEFRKWRKQPLQSWREGHWLRAYQALRENSYDAVIDAQGLFKSAFMSLITRGPRFGLDKHSARESLAALCYAHPIQVSKNQHAVQRVRELFAKSLGYSCPEGLPDYGIRKKFTSAPAPFEKEGREAGDFISLNSRATQTTSKDSLLQRGCIVFLPGTTWETKLWPDDYWHQLAELLAQDGVTIYVPWGNPSEKARAESIANQRAHVEVLPSMSLFELATLFVQAKAIVAVDTGLAHLAAALSVPTLTLYGPTNPGLTGALGQNTKHLQSSFACAPCLQERCTYQGESVVKPACFLEITPESVYNSLMYPKHFELRQGASAVNVQIRT